MPTGEEKALVELRSYQPNDDVLQEVLRAVWEIVEQSEIASELDFELLVLNLTQASPALEKSHYATSNCMAVLSEHLVIVNERFLFETEAAVRAFETTGPLEACPYLRSDEELLALTDRVNADPRGFVTRMRRATSRFPEKEEAIRHSVALTYLFYIGHELGHFLSGKDARNFTQFVTADSPLEHRLANAVVKLRRHAEEFEEFGFNLPGFERVLTPGDEIEQSSAALQQQLGRLYLNHSQFFQDEVEADDIGTQIMLEHLSAAVDDDAANTCMYRFVRGVFAAALYSWYRDLGTFCRALGIGWLSDAQDLTLAMTRDRERYILAASLFGNMHRFTLLRAERLIEAVLKARSNVFDGGQGPSSLQGSSGPDDLEKLREALARYYLLCIMMDTAVKIAYLGAATAWVQEVDRIRKTPQLFMMGFESVAKAMQCLQELIH